VLNYCANCPGGRDGQLDPDGEYFPVQVVGEKKTGQTVKYKVVWLGYEGTTWKPASLLKEWHQELIDDFRDGRDTADQSFSKTDK
jgi:hypothetical protein